MSRALLADRGVIKIGGPEAASFLHNLVTNSVAGLANGQAIFTALLTPQGKIISDGFFVKIGTEFIFDCPKAQVPDLMKRLTLYRLRAPVTIENKTDDYAIIVGWNEALPLTAHSIALFADPRIADLGWRMVILAEKDSPTEPIADADAYHAHRITLGVPEGGKDFIYGETFPHEADMDQLNGIDFKKGCYVGQEIVSRMQHRGLARTRALPVHFVDKIAPPSGTPAEAQGKSIGIIGSNAPGGKAVAILRLDRAEEAIAASAPLTAGGLAFSLETRPWIGFSVPRAK